MSDQEEFGFTCDFRGWSSVAFAVVCGALMWAIVVAGGGLLLDALFL